MKAIWNGKIIAESDDIVIVENNKYFPESAVHKEFLRESSTFTRCPWKGTANYFTLDVDGKQNPDAVWFYREPFEAAKEIKGRVAFWNGVEISND